VSGRDPREAIDFFALSLKFLCGMGAADCYEKTSIPVPVHRRMGEDTEEVPKTWFAVSIYIDIPEGQKETLAQLWSMPYEDFTALKEALNQSGYHLSPVTLIEKVVSLVPHLDSGLVKQLVRMLRGMSASFLQQGETSAEFASAVCEKAATTGVVADVGWDAARGRLVEVLDINSTVMVSFKAQGLVSDRPNTLCTSRVLTDLRPVFDELGTTPIATVPIHTLLLAYHKQVGHGETALREIFISLDQDDIIEIRDACNRALTKEAALRSLAVNSNLPYLCGEEE
jgi:hypothetical protein